MKKEKAPRNKTIDTPLSEGREYLERCLRIDAPVADIGAVLDRTVVGDAFAVCPLLPQESVDLIVADPPYNLTKQFNSGLFSRKSAEDYEAYTRRWLGAVLPLLKPTTIYVLTISIYGGMAMFLESYMLFGGNRSPGGQGLTIVGYLYRLGLEQAQMGLGSAVGLILLAITLAINLTQLTLTGFFKKE